MRGLLQSLATLEQYGLTPINPIEIVNRTAPLSTTESKPLKATWEKISSSLSSSLTLAAATLPDNSAAAFLNLLIKSPLAN